MWPPPKGGRSPAAAKTSAGYEGEAGRGLLFGLGSALERCNDVAAVADHEDGGGFQSQREQLVHVPDVQRGLLDPPPLRRRPLGTVLLLQNTEPSCGAAPQKKEAGGKTTDMAASVRPDGNGAILMLRGAILKNGGQSIAPAPGADV